MKKEEVVQALRALQQALVEEFSEKIATVHSMVDIDEGDTIDPEDYSHQYEAGEMEQLIRVQLNKAKRQLEQLNHCDFFEKSRVEPGAYVETDQFACLIACASTPFEVNGKTVLGISVDSPMYAAMLGKRNKERFAYAGKEYQIVQIL